MTWNYRLIRYKDIGDLGLHEVFYDASGKETFMSGEPATFIGAEPSEIEEALRNALKALGRPVFVPPEAWSVSRSGLTEYEAGYAAGFSAAAQGEDGPL